MTKVKRQGFIFPVKKREGILLHNIFIELASIDKGRAYEEVLSQMHDILYEIFERENHIIEIFPAECNQITRENLHIFPIELFLNSEGGFNRSLFEKIILKIKKGEKEYLPTLTTGAVTRGRDFFNQEDFINQIWELLKTKHIILTSPRRFGKTSILYHLLDYPKNGFIPLHIDLEGISDATSFVTEVIMAYNRWIMKMFEDKTEEEINVRKKELKLSIGVDWQKEWEKFCQSLNHKVLFLFDEFTMMLENMLGKEREACELLDTLHQTISNLREARCIITGSTMIKRVVDMLGYKNKDAFYPLFEEKRLPALSKEDGYEFTQILLAGIGIMPEKEKVESILNLIGSPIPFFIQLFVLEIEKGLVREAKEASTENIKKVYQERLLGAECKSYFRHYYGHLSEYRRQFLYDPMPGLKDIFEELSKAKRTEAELKPIFKRRCPRASDDDFERLMEYLEDEFYIEKVKGRYGFRCNIIRDWWLRHSRYLDTKESYGKGSF